jgi:hypothetical protein
MNGGVGNVACEKVRSDAEVEGQAERLAHSQAADIQRDRENDVECELLGSRNAGRPFIETTGEICVEATDSGKDPDEQNDGGKRQSPSPPTLGYTANENSNRAVGASVVARSPAQLDSLRLGSSLIDQFVDGRANDLLAEQFQRLLANDVHAPGPPAGSSRFYQSSAVISTVWRLRSSEHKR